MKRYFYILLLFISATANATVWEVDAGGGGQNGTPYFNPANLTIIQGDEVEWTWVTGQHNVVSTSGPESFDSDLHTAPFTWSVIFDLPGTYEYECDFLNHSDTQFGTIIVGTNSVKEIDPILAVDFSIYPNPANGNVWIEKNCTCQTDIRIIDLTGKMVMNFNSVADVRKQIDISTLTPGIYFVELNAGGNVSRKRLVIK